MSSDNANRVQFRPTPETLIALRLIAEIMAKRAPWQKVSLNDAAKYAAELGVQHLKSHPDFGPELVNVDRPAKDAA
jgi:hypothetical protein